MAQTSFEPDLAAWDAWRPSELARLPVPANGFAEIQRALSYYDLYVVGGGLAHALTSKTLAEHHQTLVRERVTGLWRLDIIGTGRPGSLVEMREFGCLVAT